MTSRESTERDFDARFGDLASVAYRAAYRLLGDAAAAEDVAQEALVRAYVRWRRVGDHAEPWVARVASNLALDILRRNGRLRSTPVPRAAAEPEGLVEERLALADLLASLPRRQREVVVLRYLADRSERETAAVLGTSVGSVKRHAHRGLARLRGHLEAQPEPGAPEVAPDPSMDQGVS